MSSIAVVRKPDLASLRALMGTTVPARSKRECFSFPGLAGGIPRGALTEISGVPGSGKSEVVLKFLAENPELRVAWVERDFTVYPCAFPQQGVELSRVLFAEAGLDSLWTVHQILRSQLFESVVVSAGNPGERELRRLQLSAEKASACVVLLTEKATRQGNWPLALQIEMSPRLRRARLLRGKGSGT